MAIKQGDWTKQDKQAWQRSRLTAELDRGLYGPDSAIARLLAEPEKQNTEPRTLEKNGRLYADVDSECFDELSWNPKTEMVRAVFWNNYEYEAPMDRETFEDWTAGSLGRFYNHILGQDWFGKSHK